ncbi:MAG TPA: phosphotransferase [Holophagaceae bacterium]|nr:phosphotransferase [Holophagaceae bacterium]
MDPRLERALDRWGLHSPQPLAGDVGARRYFRVKHPHLGTAIVALCPLDEPSKNDETYFEFRALQAYLDPLIPVPTILQSSDEDRSLLLEDLGDLTLEQRLMEHPEEEKHWAFKAGKLLATALGPLTVGSPPGAFFMARSFDQPKFDFEWAYCKVNFFDAFLKKEPPKWLERMMEEIHASLESRAAFFAHRDFHVRNLMVQGSRLVVIDFQDARRGAATYDLASILFDGYWDWSPEAGRVLFDAVREELGWGDDTLWEELNLSGIQRNLKALGTFGHQLMVKKKTHFSPAIPRTLRHLKGHFQRLRHGEGVLAIENLQRLAETRLASLGGDEEAESLG